MSYKLKSAPLSQRKYDLTLILFLYSVFAFIFGSAYRYQINPDGISELRLAGYLAEGHFMHSVVSGWCPLNVWGMSFFLLLGLDGLTAARTAIACYGAGMILVIWFLSSRFDLSENSRFIAALILALLISFWTIQFIAADVLVTAVMLLYFYMVTDPGLITRRRVPFLCGMAGGLSYLAHHYAFPFFLVHFPLIVILRGYVDREGGGMPWKRVSMSFAVGMTGFVIIASVWIGVVSTKYGRLVISAKGSVAHAAMGPRDIDRRPPHFYGGLNKPDNDYAMHVFEDVSGLKFKTWSPFENKEYFIHQLKLIKANLVYILEHFVTLSPFFTYFFVIVVLSIMVIAFKMNRLNERKRFLYAWFVITFSVYSSGFIVIIARSPRRFYALMVVFVLLAFHFMEELKHAFETINSESKKRVLAVSLIMIALMAFSVKPGLNLIRSAGYVLKAEQLNPYREIADRINTVEFSSPYAIIRSSQKPHTDIYIAYYLNKQLLGRPLSVDAAGIANELRAAGGRSILVFDNTDIVDKLKNDTQFVHLGSKKIYNKRYEDTVNINIRDHEIITGWDQEVNIFRLK